MSQDIAGAICVVLALGVWVLIAVKARGSGPVMRFGGGFLGCCVSWLILAGIAFLLVPSFRRGPVSDTAAKPASAPAEQTPKPLATVVPPEQGGYKDSKWGESTKLVREHHPELQPSDKAHATDFEYAYCYFHSINYFYRWAGNLPGGFSGKVDFDSYETPREGGSHTNYWFFEDRFVGAQVNFFNVPSVLPSLTAKYGDKTHGVSVYRDMEYIAWRLADSRIVVWSHSPSYSSEKVSYIDPAFYDRMAATFERAKGEAKKAVEKPLD